MDHRPPHPRRHDQPTATVREIGSGSDGCSQSRIGDDVLRLGEGKVGGDRDGGPFLLCGDDVEEQLGASGVDLDAAELVEAAQIEPGVAADDVEQDVVGGGFDEFVDKVGGGGVADPAVLFAGGQVN